MGVTDAAWVVGVATWVCAFAKAHQAQKGFIFTVSKSYLSKPDFK